VALKITSGRRGVTVPRILVHGKTKVGKTVFVSGAKKPLFISGEAGDYEVDVGRYTFDERDPKNPRTHALSWPEIMTATKDALAAAGDGQFDTVVFDGMTPIEGLCAVEVCRKNGWGSVAEKGYGKGENAVLAEINVWMKMVEEIWARNVGVIFVCHSRLEKSKDPQVEEYQIHSPALINANNASVAGRLCAWCDAVLYIHTEVETAKVDNGKRVTADSGRRLIHTQPAAQIVAGCHWRNVDPIIELSPVPGETFRQFWAQVEEGHSLPAMQKCVTKLAATVGQSATAGLDTLRVTPGWNDLDRLARAANKLRAVLAENGPAPIPAGPAAEATDVAA
jgi:hypothetical protein